MTLLIVLIQFTLATALELFANACIAILPAVIFPDNIGAQNSNGILRNNFVRSVFRFGLFACETGHGGNHFLVFNWCMPRTCDVINNSLSVRMMIENFTSLPIELAKQCRCDVRFLATYIKAVDVPKMVDR